MYDIQALYWCGEGSAHLCSSFVLDIEPKCSHYLYFEFRRLYGEYRHADRNALLRGPYALAWAAGLKRLMLPLRQDVDICRHIFRETQYIQ